MGRCCPGEPHSGATKTRPPARGGATPSRQAAGECPAIMSCNPDAKPHFLRRPHPPHLHHQHRRGFRGDVQELPRCGVRGSPSRLPALRGLDGNADQLGENGLGHTESPSDVLDFGGCDPQVFQKQQLRSTSHFSRHVHNNSEEPADRVGGCPLRIIQA